MVVVHLHWRAVAYVANSVLVLAVLVYFLASTLLVKRVGAALSPEQIPKPQ
jgi:hypothetical protein